jgi:hypothetical protein
VTPGRVVERDGRKASRDRAPGSSSLRRRA